MLKHLFVVISKYAFASGASIVRAWVDGFGDRPVFAVQFLGLVGHQVCHPTVDDN